MFDLGPLIHVAFDQVDQFFEEMNQNLGGLDHNLQVFLIFDTQKVGRSLGDVLVLEGMSY